MRYTTGMVRKLLAGYQRRAQGARMRAPEDRLGTRAPPLEEAPYASSSCVWSDIEQAMRALPFHHEKILWMVVCEGESSWRNGCKRYDWRRRVTEWWGRGGDDDDKHGGLTPGDVNKIVNESIQAMCDWLNVDTVNDVSLPMLGRLADGQSETVIEHDSH